VFTKAELISRSLIHHEAYIKTINIEATVTIEIAQTAIIPAAVKYVMELSSGLKHLSGLKGIDESGVKAQTEVLNEVMRNLGKIKKEIKNLEKAVNKAMEIEEEKKAALEYCHKVIPVMNRVRAAGDALETLVDDTVWPLPKYREMLFLV
jgi:glutamine synthetase